jgi:hypothetical protein
MSNFYDQVLTSYQWHLSLHVRVHRVYKWIFHLHIFQLEWGWTLNTSWLCLWGWAGGGGGFHQFRLDARGFETTRDVECRGIRWCLSFWRVWDGFSSEPAYRNRDRTEPLTQWFINRRYCTSLFNELYYFFLQLFYLISGDKRGWQWQNWPSGWEGLSHRSCHLPRWFFLFFFSVYKNFLIPAKRMEEKYTVCYICKGDGWFM